MLLERRQTFTGKCSQMETGTRACKNWNFPSHRQEMYRSYTSVHFSCWWNSINTRRFICPPIMKIYCGDNFLNLLSFVIVNVVCTIAEQSHITSAFKLLPRYRYLPCAVLSQRQKLSREMRAVWRPSHVGSMSPFLPHSCLSVLQNKWTPAFVSSSHCCC